MTSYRVQLPVLLEKAMATHSGALAWKIPWTEEPRRLQSVGSQRPRRDGVSSLSLCYRAAPLEVCDPTDRSAPDLPVHHQLPELAQTHVHRGSDAIQPSHPLSSPSPPAFSLSQHQGLFQGVGSSHQMAKGLE